MYKSDKMARVNAIATTMKFGKERIHCRNPGQRVPISYFRSSGRVRQALLASWGRGPCVAPCSKPVKALDLETKTIFNVITPGSANH